MVIGLVVAAVILVAGGVTAAVIVDGKAGRSDANAGRSAPADPAKEAEQHVLKQSVEASAVQYGSVAVFDACAVMPLALLEANGVKPYPWGSPIQDGVPDVVPADRATVRDSVDPLTSCTYLIPVGDVATEGRHAQVTFSVEQPPFNSRWSVEPLKFDYETERSVAGLTVYYSNKEAGRFGARIVKRGVFLGDLDGFRLTESYNGVSPQTFFDKLLDAVAANLAKGPSWKSRFSYQAPHDNATDACDTLSADVFSQATGEPDSGYVQRSFTDGKNYIKQLDGAISFSITQACTRFSPNRVSKSSQGKAMAVRLETFRDESSTRYADSNNCGPDNPAAQAANAVAVSEKVGDGPACVTKARNLPSYHFRVGRTAVIIENTSEWAGTDQMTAGRRLTPVAQRLAERLRR